MSKMEIVLALYRGMLNNIDAAKAAYLAKDFEKMCQMNDKSIAILVALQSHLDHKNGGAAVTNLNVFYTGVYMRLTSTLSKKDPAAEYDYIYRNIKDIYTHWLTLYKKFPDQFNQAQTTGLA